MVFGLLKDRAKAAATKFLKDPNFLEGLCAVAAYVGSASGGFSDKEESDALNRIKNNPLIVSGGFHSRDIEKIMDRMADHANGGRSGRAQLLREIEECNKNPDLAEAVLLMGLDVADDGGIDDTEKNALRKIAEVLGQTKVLEEQLAA
jgi:tellurite resistance protein